MERLLTVIVCTFNRKQILQLCLSALETQTYRDFEVVVVDDGSTDATMTMLAEYQQTSALTIRFFSQNNSGPARARNLALEHTHTPFALLLGDDIISTPKLVETHLHFHLMNPDEGEFALGYTRWDTEHQSISPFMKWYEKHQFDYERLGSGLQPTWQHAYTSNLSFKVQLLVRNPFNECFRTAAWEDSELAYRLWRQNEFRLTFLRDASATHIHPTTFQQAWKRMETLGRAERLVHTLHPELKAQIRTDLLSRVCSLLGRYPRLLKMATVVVSSMTRPGKLHSMVLRGHHQRTYLHNEES
ncbi:MAG: glycosyltransferase family 2 protein [Janthinobacterium lividum]